MTITFTCAHCNKSVDAPDDAGGKRGKCPCCGYSMYIPRPVSEEELVPLAPIDEQEERRRRKMIEDLAEQERVIFEDVPSAGSEIPLEYRENLSSEDLHHLVVNYCLDMAASNLERSKTHVAKLRQFGLKGIQAVEDFETRRAYEPALDTVNKKLLAGFFKQLKDEIKGKT